MAHDEILTNGFLRVKRGTLEMWIAVSRDYIAQRARALLAHTYGANLFLFTFSRGIHVAYYHVRLVTILIFILVTVLLFKRKLFISRSRPF